MKSLNISSLSLILSMARNLSSLAYFDWHRSLKDDLKEKIYNDLGDTKRDECSAGFFSITNAASFHISYKCLC